MKNDVLALVRGNTALLDVVLSERDALGKKGILRFGDYERWSVRVLRAGTRRCEVDVESGVRLDCPDTVTVKLPPTLPCGMYGIEVTLFRSDLVRRSYESEVFRIVETNGESRLRYDLLEGDGRSAVAMCFQLVSSSIVVGKSSYEEWLAAGNEGTLEYFLCQFLKPKVATYDEDGLISKEDKQKLDSYTILTPEETGRIFEDIFNEKTL